MPHLENHITKPGLVNDETLHVIGVCSNPARYHSRYRLAREWMAEMQKTTNVQLHMVEAAYGDRHHEVTETNNGRDLQLRTNTEIWIKENMINLGVRHLLPRDWRYMAWVDADVHFRSPSWALDTVHQLQHWPVVQPWQQCTDLGPNGSIMQTHQSFGWLRQSGKSMQKTPTQPYAYAHTGFAWACTRAFWEQSGGLLDFCILGSADHHMAWAMIGDGTWTVHKAMGPSYMRKVEEWQTRAMRVTHGQVGFVPGRIEHQFHGSKAARQYRERWQILVDAKYDPERDLMYDSQGVIKLAGKPNLEQAIRVYNRGRNEDGVDE